MPGVYDPDRHHRRSIRLRDYDYTWAGMYFVTICTYERTCCLGAVVGGEAVLSDAGRIVERAWWHLPQRFPGVNVDAFVVMPNHVHGILVLRPAAPADDGRGANHASPPADERGAQHPSPPDAEGVARPPSSPVAAGAGAG